MTDFDSMVVNFFRSTPPGVLFGGFVFCLGSLLLVLFMFWRSRRRSRLLQYRIQELEQELALYKDRPLTLEENPDDEQERLRLDLHEARQQSERDRWQLGRALPAFERVTKQNEELRRLLAEAEKRASVAEKRAAELERGTETPRQPIKNAEKTRKK